MGTILASTIIDEAALILYDVPNIRWPRTELLSYVNEAQRQIVMMHPHSNSTVHTMVTTLGTRQTIPSDGWTLLDVIRNMGTTGTTPGRAVRAVPRDLLDAHTPTWHSAPSSITASNYVFDPQDRTHFWVYPPASGAGYLQIIYAKLPTDVAEGAAIALPDVYAPAIKDYVLWRACSKKMEASPGPEIAQMHYQAFLAAVAAKNEAEATNSPNAAGVNA